MMTTIMLFRAMVMVALMIVVVSVRVRGPGRERIGELLPTIGASRHFCIGKQAGVEGGFKSGPIDI